jgi:hypothetical protein
MRVRVVSRVVGIALLWTAAWVAPALSQEAVVDASVPAQTSEDADRAALRDFLARSEVQTAARIGGVDLGRIEEGLPRLAGEDLHRAAEQMRAIDRQLGDGQGARVISIQVTTLIIVLLLVIIIILVA